VDVLRVRWNAPNTASGVAERSWPCARGIKVGSSNSRKPRLFCSILFSLSSSSQKHNKISQSSRGSFNQLGRASHLSNWHCSPFEVEQCVAVNGREDQFPASIVPGSRPRQVGLSLFLFLYHVSPRETVALQRVCLLQPLEASR
jgi:hypothetical protein